MIYSHTSPKFTRATFLTQCLLLLFFFSCSSEKIDLTQQTPASAHERFKNILNRFEEERLQLYPQYRSKIKHLRLAEIDDVSNAIIQRLENLYFTTERHILKNVNTSLLDSVQQKQFATFTINHKDLTLYKTYWYHLNFLDPFDGKHTEATRFLLHDVPLKTERDARDYIAKLVDTKRKFRSLLKRLGLKESEGLIPPKELRHQLIVQLKAELNIQPEQHPIYKKLEKALPAISFEHLEPQKLLNDCKYHLENTYNKRLKKILTVLENQQSASETLRINNAETFHLYIQTLSAHYKFNDSNRRTLEELTLSEADNIGFPMELLSVEYEPYNYFKRVTEDQKRQLKDRIDQHSEEDKRMFFNRLKVLLKIDYFLNIEAKPREDIERYLRDLSINQPENLLNYVQSFPCHSFNFLFFMKN